MALPGRFQGRAFDETLLEDAGPALNETLSELPPRFFIPRLADKPQNPIMDTLRLMRNAEHVKHAETTPLLVPLELGLLSEDIARFATEKEARLDDIWQLAASHTNLYKVRACARSLSCSLYAVPSESGLVLGCVAPFSRRECGAFTFPLRTNERHVCFRKILVGLTALLAPLIY